MLWDIAGHNFIANPGGPVVGAQAKQQYHRECTKDSVFAVTADQAKSAEEFSKQRALSKDRLESASVLFSSEYCRNALYGSVETQPLLQSLHGDLPQNSLGPTSCKCACLEEASYSFIEDSFYSFNS
jgi:hypothetical protein